MRYKTHLAGGLALGYVAFNNINLLNVDLSDSKTFMIASAGLVLGSLFPDIDIATSYLSNKIKLVSFFTSKLFKHRGYTHSIVGAVSMSMLMYLILGSFDISHSSVRMFSTAFSIGIISHIMLDLMTYSGVELLYPFNSKRIKAGKFCLYNFHKWNFAEFILVIAFGFIAYKSLILHL